MASSHGQLCRDLVGGSLMIKGKLVIDEKGNLTPCNATIKRDLTVNGLTCLNDTSITNIEIVNDYQPYDLVLLQRPSIYHENFVGDYAEENWTIDLQGGSVEFDISGNTLTMVSADDTGNSFATQTTACISKTFEEQTNVYFTWSYTSNDVDSPFYDPFGYQVNGNFVQLTDNDGANVQTGIEIVNLSPNSEFTFCFNQQSTDQDAGNATTIISDFKVGGKAKVVGRKVTIA